MGIQVVNGAMLQCSFGLAPSTLNVPPALQVFAGGMPAANIMNHAPIVNVAPFGMCTSLANPTVASATAAALGVLTPMPCMPVLPAPWAPGSPSVLVNSLPALNDGSKCVCAWAGVVSIAFPGQLTVQIP